MKKIFSIVLATMIAVSMLSMVAMAADTTFTLSTDENNYSAGDVFTLNIAETGSKIAGFVLLIDFDESAFELVSEYDEDEEEYVYLVGAGLFSPALVMNPEYVANKISYAGMSTSNQNLTGGYITIKVKDDAPSGTYSFDTTVKAGSVVTKSGTPKTSEVSSCSVTIAGSSGGGEEEDGEVTVGSAASFATDDGTAVGSKAILGATGGEYGSAFRITFTRPEGATDNGVIFGIDLDGTKVFAPKQANLLAGVLANSAVTVDVSFLNGSTAAGKAGFIASQEITGISVILSDGAGKFFYSDSTDKAHKAPIAE